jgi:deoxyribose-phosphate aldolase
MSEESQLKIAVGSDHAGFTLKEELRIYLSEKGYCVSDCGTFSKESVDYPKFAFAVAIKVSEGESQFGLIVDGAGIGSAMVANKLKGVRAAMCNDLSAARNAREHNNANVLTLGAGVVDTALAKQIVDLFLKEQCTIDRHLKRVQMIDDLDQWSYKNNGIDKSKGPQIKETNSLNITNEDIANIAERIKAMLGSHPGSPNEEQPAVCGAEVCTDCGQCADKAPDTVRHLIDLGVDRISYGPGGEKVPKDIARYIDHTLLRQDANVEDIRKLCAEAKEFNFASVCINPTFVPLAVKELENTIVDVCTVVGFPFGTHLPEIKAHETRNAIREGAKEIDMVINIGALKSGDEELLYKDIRMVAEACEDGGALSKVIIEAALLNDEEKVLSCQIAKRARANYVKTSTGFGPGGATEHDVALMSQAVKGAGIGVKAAGGIRTLEDAQKMIKAGATRIGASAGIKIVKEANTITVSE